MGAGAARRKSISCKVILVGVFGVALFIWGNVFAYFWPNLFDYILHQNLMLKNNSDTLRMWQAPRSDILFQVYLFNCTNPEAVMNGLEKPVVTQMGPYAFQATRSKENVVWHANMTVTYQIRTSYRFLPEKSNGSLLDVVTAPNVPIWSVSHMARNQKFPVKFVLSKTIRMMNTNAFIRKRAGELIFDGYPDSMLKLASFVSHLRSQTSPDRFGWFYGRNATLGTEGHLSIYTGESDITKLGSYAWIDHEPYNSFFKSPCNKVEGGYGGEMWPPGRKKDNITLYSYGACRTLILNFREEVQVKGVPAYRYASDEDFLGRTEPITGVKDCQCGMESDASCLPRGVQNLSSCRGGAPIILSLPHFLHADESYVNAVDGLEPSEDKHQFVVELEPLTGVPVHVAARVQMNLYLHPIPGMKVFERLPELIYPSMWLENSFTADDEVMAPKLRLVARVPALGYLIAYLTIGVGAVVIFLFAALQIPRERFRSAPTSNDDAKADEGEPLRTAQPVGLYPQMYRSPDVEES